MVNDLHGKDFVVEQAKFKKKPRVMGKIVLIRVQANDYFLGEIKWSPISWSQSEQW